MFKTAFFTALLATAASAQVIQIINNCPGPIDYYVGDTRQGSLASRASTVRSLDDTEAFVSARTGRGGDQAIVRARVKYFEPFFMYYLVKDEGKGQINAGVAVGPLGVPENKYGFCAETKCEKDTCSAPSVEPVVDGPPPASTLPRPPVYQCNIPKYSTFKITFCPSGEWPENEVKSVRQNGNPQRCLDVRDGVFQNGQPVQIWGCNGTPAQNWVLQGTQLRLANTPFCLDAGTNPVNGFKAKIWECYDNLSAQKWTTTSAPDNFIRMVDNNLCLDLTDGLGYNGNQLQVWECGSGNINQNWQWQ